ncbi:MAG: acyltransferase family protein [Pseudomonadales bacterium]|nr:acyltransferase family protein [Pseudomonadales bacterium]
MSQDRILHIEKLRAISILLVLLYHLEIPGFKYGYLGVDLFFVISGYLMAMLYGEIRTWDEAKIFFRKRFARILPAYFTLIIVTIAVAILVLLPHEIELVMTHSLWSVLLLPNFGFWLDASYFEYLYFRPLLNLWSLGVELQFYLLFPLLLFVRRNTAHMFALIGIVSIVLYAITSLIDSNTAFFMLPGRLWEFFAGILAANLRINQVARQKFWGLLAITSLIAFLLALSFFEIDYLFFVSLLVVVLAAITINFGFSTGLESNLVSRSLVLIGQYSYSIYLVHFPVIVFANYLPFGGTILQANSLLKLSAILGLIAVLSYLLYNFVETRTRSKFNGVQLSIASACAVVLVVIMLNPAVSLGKRKFSIVELTIYNALEDRGSYQCEGVSILNAPGAESCRLDRLSSPLRNFMLIGDSHADAIKDALLEATERAGNSLIYYKEYRAISESFVGNEVLTEALDQQVDTIVIHQLGQADEGQAIENFTRLANEVAIQVVVISPVPSYGFSIPEKLFRDYTENGVLTLIGDFSTEHESRVAGLKSRLDIIQSNYDNFHWFDASDLLCDQNCYISNPDGGPLYYDSNHLTLTGAERLSAIFEEINELEN